MSNAVEILDKLERRLTLTVDIPEVTKEVEKRIRIRAKTTRVDGFRPGKVPLKKVTEMYGPYYHSEVLNEKVSQAYAQAVQENNLKVAGTPEFTEKTDGDVGADKVAFYAKFEVFPEVKIGDLSNVELERATMEVSDAEVDKTINMLRKRQAIYHVRGEDSEHGRGNGKLEAENGDRVTIDYTGKIDGVEFDGGKAQDFPFVLGEKLMLPEFEAAVLGLKAGESKTFTLNFPENYHGKDVAGKAAEFTVSVKKVEWPHLPEVNDDFAKSIGVPEGGVAKLREDILKNLKLEVKNRVTAINKNRVMDALLEVSSFDVPKALIEDEISALVEMTRRDLAVRNPAQKDAEIPRDIFKAQAEKRVRLGLLLAELRDNNVLAVSSEKLKERAEEIASSYENPQMVKDYYLNDPTRRKELENIIMEENAVEYVFGKVKVTEKAVDFESLMAQRV